MSLSLHSSERRRQTWSPSLWNFISQEAERRPLKFLEEKKNPNQKTEYQKSISLQQHEGKIKDEVINAFVDLKDNVIQLMVSYAAKRIN
jgi:hypothetical protein